MKFLSILLPTYNRSKDLYRNLQMLSNYIRSLDYNNIIEIIISNNCSTDDTEDICKLFIKGNQDISIKYYSQPQNLGIELNSIFVLSKSQAQYIMFLGDDDYISLEYLQFIINYLHHNTNIGCIISSWQGIYPNGDKTPVSRDLNIGNRLYKAGIRAVIQTGWRAHQLSGIVLKREGLYETYKKNKVHTIYPHIYLASVSMLTRNAYLITDYPILITQPGQDKKDWNYGKDGLINHKLEGYKRLPLNWFYRNIIQIACILRERNMITRYANKSFTSFITLIGNILFGKHILILARFFFPFYILYLILRGSIRKLKKR